MSSVPQTPPVASAPNSPILSSVPQTVSVSSAPQTPSPTQSIPLPKSKFKRFWEWEPTEKTKNRCCWRFLKKSKIPGLKEVVAEDTHVFWRIFWVIASFACLVAGLHWMSEKRNVRLLVSDWMFISNKDVKKNPTVRKTKTETYPANKIPYAITIEKMNSFTANGLDELQKMKAKLYESRGEEFIEHNGYFWSEEEVQALGFVLNQICMPNNKLSGWFSKEKVPSDNPFGDSLVDHDLFYDDEKTAEKIADLIRKVTPPCSETFVACTWNYRNVDCATLFHDVYSESGAMCSFNAMPIHLAQKNASMLTILNKRNMTTGESDAWQKLTTAENYLLPVNISEKEFGRKVFSIPDSQQRSGIRWGLRSVLKFNPKEKYCMQPDTFAYRAVVHYPTRRGDPGARGFTIPPNHELTVHIIPVMHSASNSTKDNSKPTDRHCYFKSEAQELERYEIYTFENCESECVAKKVEKECNCTHLYYPRSPTSKTRICVSDEDMICIHSVELAVFGKDATENCSHCLPNCNTGTFQTIITSVAYSQDEPPEIVKLLRLNTEIPTAILRASIDEPMIQIFEDDMARDLLEKFTIISGILGTTNNLSALDVLKFLVALFTIPVPVKTCIDILKFLWNQILEALKPIPARKIDASFFGEIQRINVGLIQLGETKIPPSDANPEGATMQEIGVDMQIVEEMEEVDTVLKKFMRDYCSEYGRHWTDWAGPRVLVTTSLDGCGPNLASRPRSPPFRPHPKSSAFRRGSAPAGMSQKSEDEVAEDEAAPPFRLPPFPNIYQVFFWYLTKGHFVKPPQQAVATPSEGQQAGNNSNANCLKTFLCCCTVNETENCDQSVPVTPSFPSPPSTPQQGPSSPPTASSSFDEMPLSTIVEAFDANEAGVSTSEPLFRKTFKQVSTKLITVQSLFPDQHVYENPGFESDNEILNYDDFESINLEEPLEPKSITP